MSKNPVSFTSYMPVEIFFGIDCIFKNTAKFEDYKKVFVVTGKSSGKKSGALNDIFDILGSSKADFKIFDEITENPLLSVCFKGGRLAYEFGADLIIGIGGGSPVDAAKAIALFAANPDMQPDNLFTPPYTNPALPVFAVPTTAGTGTEANPYSVITLDDMNIKRTYNHPYAYPKAAFLDPKYTYSMPYNTTVSTALDSFCHCIESYLSPKATVISTDYALRGAKYIYQGLTELSKMRPEDKPDISHDMRELLFIGSLLGGMAINVTGTGFPHPMGYNLTLLNGLPHGKACAVFLGEYLSMHNEYKNITCNSEETALIDILFKEVASIEDIKATVNKLVAYNEKFDDETLKLYTDKIKDARNFSNSLRKINVEQGEVFDIYKRVIGKNFVYGK